MHSMLCNALNYLANEVGYCVFLTFPRLDFPRLNFPRLEKCSLTQKGSIEFSFKDFV